MSRRPPMQPCHHRDTRYVHEHLSDDVAICPHCFMHPCRMLDIVGELQPIATAEGSPHPHHSSH